MRTQCPVCGYQTVIANGKHDASYLIVGDAPSFEDVKIGLPFTGKIGEMLSYELAREGIQLQRCRLITIWPHSVTKNIECMNTNFSLVLSELLKPREGVLFTGNEIPGLFGLPPVKDISGLVMPVLNNIQLEGRFVFINNLFSFQNGMLGELRFALKNLRGK
jgi:hypothetical protein